MPDVEVKTVVFLHDAVNPEDLYDTALSAMLDYDTTGKTWTDVQRFEMPIHDKPGMRMIVPVGLSSKMVTVYKEDGTDLSDAGDFLLRHAACSEPKCSPEKHYPSHRMSLAFATNIGYQDSRGWNCGQYHAALIYRVGEFLDNAGIKWSWASQVSDEIHEGYDSLSRMGELFDTYQQKVAFQIAMANVGPFVPVNSLLGLMILAEKVSAQRDEEEDEEDEEEDKYAPYVEED